MTQTLKPQQPIKPARPVPVTAAPSKEAKPAATVEANLHRPAAAPRLLDQLTEAARQHGHTEEAATTMAEWCRRYVLFHGVRHPQEMGLPEIGRFLRRKGVGSHSH